MASYCPCSVTFFNSYSQPNKFLASPLPAQTYSFLPSNNNSIPAAFRQRSAQTLPPNARNFHVVAPTLPAATAQKREQLKIMIFDTPAAGKGMQYELIMKKVKLRLHAHHQDVESVLSTFEDIMIKIIGREVRSISMSILRRAKEASRFLPDEEIVTISQRNLICVSSLCSGAIFWLASAQVTLASEGTRINEVYEVGELFELGIQLSYLLLLLALLGVGSFFVIRQVLVRRELDLSAKELQEQVRSGDASAMGLFELGAVMLRRKFYPAATKYLLQAIEKWDGDDQDLAQVYNALGVSYVRDEKIDKGIAQFEKAVKLQPGYVTAWNNLGDAYEKKKDFKSALKAFEEALLFDPNNKIARPRRESLKDKVKTYEGVAVKSKKS